jgi:hypothetical protein
LNDGTRFEIYKRYLDREDIARWQDTYHLTTRVEHFGAAFCAVSGLVGTNATEGGETRRCDGISTGWGRSGPIVMVAVRAFVVITHLVSRSGEAERSEARSKASRPKEANVRKALLAVAVITGLGVYAYAQTTAKPQLSLSFVADSVTRRPAFGYDGVVREGPADDILTASGNVVVRVNDVRMTADTAVWHWGSREIELAGGSVRIELPIAPTSIHFENRR